MHIKEKFISRIIAMTMCILLLSEFGLKHVLAMNQAEVGFVNISTTSQIDTSVKYDQMVINLSEDELGLLPEYFDLQVFDDAVYTIDIRDDKGNPVRYNLTTNGEVTRLAVRYRNGTGTLITTDTSSDSTKIDTVLTAGKNYNVTIDSPITSGITVTIKKRNMGSYPMAVSNIPTTVISNRFEYENGYRYPLETTDFKESEFSNDELREYLIHGIPEEEDKLEPGGFLEGLLVDIVLALGSIFMFLVETILGVNTNLTIDSIIFNRFEHVVIDLTPLGGINVNATGKGIFYDANVGNVINILYNALKSLAVAIYVVMLLFVGVRILSSIGGKNQKKYWKYVEYWLTGIILLNVIPYFLPAIPAINNGLISQFESQAKSMHKYSVYEVLDRLDYDASLLGEDAETVELLGLVEERLGQLNEQLYELSGDREYAQENRDEYVNQVLDNLYDLDGSDEAVLRDKIVEITNYLNDYARNWDSEKDAQYYELMGDLRTYIYENSEATVEITKELVNNIPETVRNNNTLAVEISKINEYLQKNAPDWTSNVEFNNMIVNLGNLLTDSGVSHSDRTQTLNQLTSIKNEYISFAQDNSTFRNIEALMRDYKMDVIQGEISELEEIRDSIDNDVMTKLKTKAGSENRFVYALAWAILLFEMFAVLFMYYKRVIAIVILVIIFPLIMAFYVIDKIGDGKADSLENWLKELIANITVQLIHAITYLVLINSAIDICDQDPEKNWFILLLAVCFLFPGERILRAILGLNSSMLGGLRVNVTSIALGAHATASLLKAGYRGAKGVAQGKYSPSNIKKKYEEEARKERERQEKIRNEKQQQAEKAAKRRKKNRQEREKRIANGQGKKTDKIFSAVDKVRDTLDETKQVISGFTTVRAAKAAVGAVNKVRDSNAYRYGKMTLKRGAKLAWGTTRKGAGIAFGAVEGMENVGQEGITSAVFTATEVAKDIGGFKGFSAPPKEVQDIQAKVENPSQFTTEYKDGQKVFGTGKTTEGNIDVDASNQTMREQVREQHKAETEAAQVEVKTNIERIENDSTRDSNSD